jgi:hypothetical protein
VATSIGAASAAEPSAAWASGEGSEVAVSLIGVLGMATGTAGGAAVGAGGAGSDGVGAGLAGAGASMVARVTPAASLKHLLHM